jgi:hypothetical protein
VPVSHTTHVPLVDVVGRHRVFRRLWTQAIDFALPKFLAVQKHAGHDRIVVDRTQQFAERLTVRHARDVRRVQVFVFLPRLFSRFCDSVLLQHEAEKSEYQRTRIRGLTLRPDRIEARAADLADVLRAAAAIAAHDTITVFEILSHQILRTGDFVAGDVDVEVGYASAQRLSQARWIDSFSSSVSFMSKLS